MARSYLDYRKLLQAHFPRGRFWTREEGSDFTKLLNGLGEILSDLEERSEELVEEAFPTRIQETFEEWEEDFAIPDEGKELEDTDAGRREVIHAKLVAVGGQNSDYFIEIAEALGYTITTEGFEKSLVGIMTPGSSIVTDSRARYFWFVNIDVPEAMTHYFTKANISQLIIDISTRQPGHTIALFRFTGVEFDRSFSHDFDCTPYYDGSSWPLSFSRDFSHDFSNAYDYDGIMLTGAFSNAFDLSFDSYRGGAFNYDEWSDDFSKPS